MYLLELACLMFHFYIYMGVLLINFSSIFVKPFCLFFFSFATYCFLSFVKVAHDKNELI